MQHVLTLMFALAWRGNSAVTGVESTCTKAATSPCSRDGTSATYTETIVGDVRQIRAGGCPNNNPHTPCIKSNPSESSVQNWNFNVPASPKLKAADYATSLAQALTLNNIGGIIGVTVNGIEIRSCYGGTKYGVCTDYATSATAVEGDTFDYCGGHGNPYHYHQAPYCLLAQMGARSDGSSPLVGWAADGFPIYGNKGPGGVLIKRCGQSGADAKYCADACGGYYGIDYNDSFKFRYFMMGQDADMKTNPLTPTTAQEYFPYVPYCLLGCGSMTATGTDKTPSIGGKLQQCTGTAVAGTADGYAATASAGVTAAFDTQNGTAGGTTGGAVTTGALVSFSERRALSCTCLFALSLLQYAVLRQD